MNRIRTGLCGIVLALCLTTALTIPALAGSAGSAGPAPDMPPASTRHYLSGVYAGPTDDSTPTLMGYRWDYTIGRSYQDTCAGCGVSGLSYLHGYPVVIDIQHVQPSYPDFKAAAEGRYDTYYRQTAAALAPYAHEIYAVRIDSEFNGSWAVSTPFTGWFPVSRSTWIAGFRRLVLAVRQELPNAKIIWNPNIGQHDPFPYYPGDDVVDLIGPDVYCNPAHYGSAAACWKDFLGHANGVNLNAIASFALTHHKALAIPEWADLFGDGFFIKQMQEWMDQNNVVLQSYWDSGDDLGRPGSLLDLPTNQKAYVKAFGHRPYAGTFWSSILPIPAGATEH
ncbi:hypothetical protein [Acidisoma sp.]|uniref:hypothetical protein n=1 Tax=Acidisoma sp. TaxID=1872115 RepID=UPI003B008623